jgi:hypothetical protein
MTWTDWNSIDSSRACSAFSDVAYSDRTSFSSRAVIGFSDCLIGWNVDASTHSERGKNERHDEADNGTEPW